MSHLPVLRVLVPGTMYVKQIIEVPKSCSEVQHGKNVTLLTVVANNRCRQIFYESKTTQTYRIESCRRLRGVHRNKDAVLQLEYLYACVVSFVQVDVDSSGSTGTASDSLLNNKKSGATMMCAAGGNEAKVITFLNSTRHALEHATVLHMNGHVSPEEAIRLVAQP